MEPLKPNRQALSLLDIAIITTSNIIDAQTQSSPIIPASGVNILHTMMTFNPLPLAALEIQKAPFQILPIAEPEERISTRQKVMNTLYSLSTPLYWNHYSCIRRQMSHTFPPSSNVRIKASLGDNKNKSVCIVSWHRWLFLGLAALYLHNFTHRSYF